MVHRCLNLLVCLLLACNSMNGTERPHIVFVMADDMGRGDVGCYGGTLAPTPNIDRLAEQGTRFDWYYSASPICSPSRCGLITGQFPARWHITSYLQTREGNRACEQADFLDPLAPSLPRMLRAAGYATAHVGKWHLGGGRDVIEPPKFAAYGYDFGFGTYESPEPAAPLGLKTTPWGPDAEREPQQVPRHDRTRWMVDTTLDFLKQHPTQPCFINLWLDDTHTPWRPLAPTDGKPNDPARLAAVITELDRQIGRLMDTVPANTLLIFTTDNGALPTLAGLRTGGLRGSKLSLYEGGIRLPFIARWPGVVPAGQVNSTTVLAATDMAPTLLAIAGAVVPDNLRSDGEDLSAAIRGTSVERSQPLFWEYGRNETSFAYPAGRDRSPSLAMRDGRWKLLVQPDGSAAELYDLSTDAVEATNVAASNQSITESMTRATLSWWTSLPMPRSTD